MEIFKKPENLNGTELKKQLATVGIVVAEIYDYSNGTIGFETDNQEKAAEIVAKHVGTVVPPEPTIEDKLASVGLNLSDFKTALGI